MAANPNIDWCGLSMTSFTKEDVKGRPGLLMGAVARALEKPTDLVHEASEPNGSRSTGDLLLAKHEMELKW